MFPALIQSLEVAGHQRFSCMHRHDHRCWLVAAERPLKNRFFHMHITFECFAVPSLSFTRLCWAHTHNTKSSRVTAGPFGGGCSRTDTTKSSRQCTQGYRMASDWASAANDETSVAEGASGSDPAIVCSCNNKKEVKTRGSSEQIERHGAVRSCDHLQMKQKFAMHLSTIPILPSKYKTRFYQRTHQCPRVHS